MHPTDDKTARAELLHALVGLFPWAVSYIETQRTPLHGIGEFDRIARARELIERELGPQAAALQLGEPRHLRARFKDGERTGTLAEFLDLHAVDWDMCAWLKTAKPGSRYRGIMRIR